MKTKITIGIFLLFVAIAAYLFMRAKAPSTPATNSSAEMGKGKTSEDVPSPMPPATVPQSNQEETDFGSVLTPKEKELLSTGYVLTAEERGKLTKRKRQKDLSVTPEEIMIMMHTPVEFYGQVLDQFDAPVVGAKIICYWPYMESTDAPFGTQSSAPNGQFEILGFKSALIDVLVEAPPGYTNTEESKLEIQIGKTPDRILQNEAYKKLTPEERGSIPFARESYKADKTKPIVFRLKKL